MNKNPSKTIIKPQETITKLNPITNNEQQGKELTFNRKKKEYKSFIKLIKQGKTIPATILAQTLGVNRSTIIEWYKTPQALKSLSEDINYHVENIKKSKDWRASAYLLDKIGNNPEDQKSPHDLKQLIVINT